MTTLERSNLAKKSRFWLSSPMNKEGMTFISDSRREEIRVLYMQGKVPLAIAHMMGLSVAIVSKYLREAGIKVPSYLTTQEDYDDTAPVHGLSGETHKDILTLRRQGLVPLAIADCLGLSMGTVTKYRRELQETGEIEKVPAYLSGAPRSPGLARQLALRR